MSHEITLEQATEMAYQTEIISRMMKIYPQQFSESDISAIASLLSQLSGSVTAWLMEEKAEREART